MSKTTTKESQLSSIVVGATKETLRKVNVAAAMLDMSKKDFVSNAITQYIENNEQLKNMNFQSLIDTKSK